MKIYILSQIVISRWQYVHRKLNFKYLVLHCGPTGLVKMRMYNFLRAIISAFVGVAGIIIFNLSLLVT